MRSSTQVGAAEAVVELADRPFNAIDFNTIDVADIGTVSATNVRSWSIAACARPFAVPDSRITWI